MILIVLVVVVVVVVEEEKDLELEGLHPSLLFLSWFEFAMWIRMIPFAMVLPCARYVLEEAVVSFLPFFLHDGNFFHRVFEWLCETKEYVVEYCSTSEKVVAALGVFRLHNFQFVA